MASIPAALLPAPDPFNKRGADIVLASSNHVAFRVHSRILSVASGFFEHMFSLPNVVLEGQSQTSMSSLAGTQPLHEGLPCITVSEDGQTLERLLRLCYPVQDPALSSVEELSPVLEAAIKYDMPEATRVLKLGLRGFIPHAPLAVYCVACHHDFEDIASQAASVVCVHGLQDIYVPQLRQISFGCYNRLLRYKRLGQNSASTSFSFVREPQPAGAEATLSPRSATGAVVHDASFIHSMRHSDIILRSRDGHEYPVHEDIIVLASPKLGQKVRDAHVARYQRRLEDGRVTADGKIIIPVEENGETLSLLLRMLDPVGSYSRDLRDVGTMCSALSAAQKHQITAVVEDLESRIITTSEDRPMETFLACVNYGLIEEAKRTVPKVLARSEEELYAYLPEMDHYDSLSGDVYFRLLQHHRQCQQVAKTWSEGLRSSNTSVSSIWPISQNNGRCQACYGAPRCGHEDDFSRQFQISIATGQPCLYAARPMGVLLSFLSGCTLGRHPDVVYWREYAEAFARKLHDALPKFEFERES